MEAKMSGGVYEAQSSTNRAMREGDLEMLELPGLCVAKARKLRKWVKVDIVGMSSKAKEDFTASNGVTLQVVPDKLAGRDSDKQWWGIPLHGQRKWYMAEKSWKKFVRASKEWAKAYDKDFSKEPIQVQVHDTKNKQAPPKYSPRVTYGPKTQAALNQLLEGSEKYRGMVKELCDKHDMLPKEAREHLELSNIHHFASLSKDPGPLSFKPLRGDCDDVVEIEIGGEMCKGVFFHNGYRMIQARETQWVPEEKLLCVGFEPNHIIASKEDAHAIDHLVCQYEQHRTEIYTEGVDSEDVKQCIAASLGQEQASSEAAELERVRCLVEKQRQVIRQVINDVRDEATDALRNAVIYEAEAHEARAAELRDILSYENAENRLLDRIEAAIDTIEGDVPDAEDEDELGNDGMLPADELQKIWLGELSQDEEQRDDE